MLSSPLHASPKDALEQTQKDIAQARERQSEIKAETRRLNRELKELKEKLVATAKAAQGAESSLSATEGRLSILDRQLEDKKESLEKRRGNLAALTAAALRLSRLPPEAMLMMPQGSEQGMKASRALKMTAQSVRREMRAIGIQMNELEQLKKKVAESRTEFSRRQADLDGIRRKLQDRLDERKKLQASLGREQKEEAAKVAALARKAEDLKELVATLIKEEKKRGVIPAGHKGKLRSFARARGRIGLPAAGKVTRAFGSGSKYEVSKGITIATRSGAEVISPYDGEVLFTGPFLNFGQLIILRHSDDFHTLLGGLSRIDTRPGEFLLEGEPIGAMGEEARERRLYLELRKNNRPIDPAPWILGLKK